MRGISLYPLFSTLHCCKLRQIAPLCAEPSHAAGSGPAFSSEADIQEHQHAPLGTALLIEVLREDIKLHTKDLVAPRGQHMHAEGTSCAAASPPYSPQPASPPPQHIPALTLGELMDLLIMKVPGST